jgi:hypothetical protein
MRAHTRLVRHQGITNLYDRMDRLAAHDPTFCDITWGAGGSTAGVTMDIAINMQQKARCLRCFPRFDTALTARVCWCNRSSWRP